LAARVSSIYGAFVDLPTRLDTVENTVATQLAEMTQYVKPTGTEDDTTMLQNAINLYPSLTLKSGTYKINAVVNGSNYGWTIPSNRTIIFEPGAILQTITNAEDNYRVMFFNNVDNINIYNPVLYGDRATHTGITGEGGHGIGLYGGCSNINIYNPTCNNFWGVGIALVDQENVNIINAVCDNNRQNGIALIKGRNVTLYEPKCTNTNGTLPSGGIDIEPNNGTDYVENIKIIRPETSGNDGAGIFIALANLIGSTNDVSIIIDSPLDDGSAYGSYIGKLEYSAMGKLGGVARITNPTYLNSQRAASYINNYASQNTPSLIFDKPVILNPNSLSEIDGNGFTFKREIAATNTNKMGNLTIINPDIRDIRTVPKMIFCMDFNDEKDQGFEKVFIIDPLALEGTVTNDLNYKISIRDGGVNVSDRKKLLVGNFSSNRILLDRVYTRLTNIGATALVNFTLSTSAFLIDAPTTFVVEDADGIKLTPSVSMNILPLSAVNGKFITSTNLGSSITIRKLSSASWIIENMIGTWTVEP